MLSEHLNLHSLKMNNKEALKLIIENNQKNKDKLVIDDYNEFNFERLLKDFVSYLWIKQHPEHFLNCHVTVEEEYDNNNCCAYSWYMAMNNGRFNFRLFKLTGYDKFKLRQIYGEDEGIKIYKSRMNEIFKSAKESSDIVSWAINHFILK